MKKMLMFLIFTLLFTTQVFAQKVEFVDYNLNNYTNKTSTQYRELEELDKYYEGIKTYFKLTENPKFADPKSVMLGMTMCIYQKEATLNMNTPPYNDMKMVYRHMLNSYCNYSMYDRFDNEEEIKNNLTRINNYISNLKNQIR